LGAAHLALLQRDNDATWPAHQPAAHLPPIVLRPAQSGGAAERAGSGGLVDILARVVVVVVVVDV